MAITRIASWTGLEGVKGERGEGGEGGGAGRGQGGGVEGLGTQSAQRYFPM